VKVSILVKAENPSPCTLERGELFEKLKSLYIWELAG